MLPLEHLTVHAFRGLRDVELTGLGRLNLLVGSNNSGKTTVLEAIATFARPLSPSEWVETARRREITPSRASMLEALRWMFPQPGSGSNGAYEGTTSVSGEGRSPIRRSEARLTEVEGYFDAELEQPDPLQRLEDGGAQRGLQMKLQAFVSPEQGKLFEEERDLSAEVTLWERSRGPIAQNRAGPSLPLATITPFSHRMQRLDVEALSEAIFEGIKSQVLELVRIFDDEIVDLQVLKRPRAEPTVYVRHKRLGNAPLSSFGDGMRRLLLLGVTLATVRGGVLLVDEIESAIHVEALDHAFRWLRRACADLDVQLFATTHSLEAVDALLAARDVGDDLVLYRLARQGGGTRVTRLQGTDLRVLREELGQEVRA
ncbi:MAG TPA: AAA family ATPase [Candidatus Nanopelagicales bacterium]|nr:AAA family ATPase [Candidatus Nanopelagicales bacterium]